MPKPKKKATTSPKSKNPPSTKLKDIVPGPKGPDCDSNPPPMCPKGTVAEGNDLSKEQDFYIAGNMEVLTDQQIADDLKLPLDVVQQHIISLRKKEGVSRASTLMQRPAPGVVAMTEAASMVGDEFKSRGRVTQAEINRASAEGNYQLAAELAEKMRTQSSTSANDKDRYTNCWHMIRK